MKFIIDLLIIVGMQVVNFVLTVLSTILIVVLSIIIPKIVVLLACLSFFPFFNFPYNYLVHGFFFLIIFKYLITITTHD